MKARESQELASGGEARPSRDVGGPGEDGPDARGREDSAPRQLRGSDDRGPRRASVPGQGTRRAATPAVERPARPSAGGGRERGD